MECKRIGKGKVEGRNKTSWKVSYLQIPLCALYIFIYKNAIYFCLVLPIGVDCGLSNAIFKDKCMMCAINHNQFF